MNAVKNLGTIAVALGTERTRNELLPYITGEKIIIIIHRFDG